MEEVIKMKEQYEKVVKILKENDQEQLLVNYNNMNMI